MVASSTRISLNFQCCRCIQVPCHVRVVNTSTRMAMIIFTLGFYVVFVHYTCNLTSRMTSDGETMKDLRSYDDVIRHGVFEPVCGSFN